MHVMHSVVSDPVQLCWGAGINQTSRVFFFQYSCVTSPAKGFEHNSYFQCIRSEFSGSHFNNAYLHCWTKGSNYILNSVWGCDMRVAICSSKAIFHCYDNLLSKRLTEKIAGKRTMWKCRICFTAHYPDPLWLRGYVYFTKKMLMSRAANCLVLLLYSIGRGNLWRITFQMGCEIIAVTSWWP